MAPGALTLTPRRRANISTMRQLGLHFRDIGNKQNLKTDPCAQISRHTTRDFTPNEKRSAPPLYPIDRIHLDACECSEHQKVSIETDINYLLKR